MEMLARAGEIVERALRAAEGDEADVSCVVGDRALTRFANSRIHQNLADRTVALTMRVLADGRLGVAST